MRSSVGTVWGDLWGCFVGLIGWVVGRDRSRFRNLWEFVGWPRPNLAVCWLKSMNGAAIQRRELKVNPRNEEVYVTVKTFGRKFHTQRTPDRHHDDE